MFGVIKLNHQPINSVDKTIFSNMNLPKYRFDGRIVEEVAIQAHSCYYSEQVPYIETKGQYLVLWTGKIFNKKELQKLLRPARSCSSLSEILSLLYLQLGAKFVQRVRGEFIILIFDKQHQQVLVFRDRIGLTPFYYAIHNTSLYFSTEIKRLSAQPIFNETDLTYLKLKLLDVIPNTLCRTFFNSIKKIPPSSWLTIVGNTKPTLQQYYTFPKDIKYAHLAYEQCITKFRNALKTAIQRQIEHAESIHTHCSGGLDSTGITAIAQELAIARQQPLFTYFNGLDNRFLKDEFNVGDSREMLQLIAAETTLPYPEMVTYNPYAEGNEAKFNLHFFDQMKYYLKNCCEKIHERKGSILLSGFGGDECVSYNNFPIFLTHAFWSLRWSNFFSDGKAYSFKQCILMILYKFPFLDKVIKWYNPKIFIPRYYRELPNILKDQFVNLENPPTVYDKSYSLNEAISKFLSLPFISWRIEQEKEYAAYYGIEMRYPWLDIDLIEFFLGLPSKYKMLNQKGRELYRQAIKKWIDCDGFLNQPKANGLATVPAGTYARNLNIKKYQEHPKAVYNLSAAIKEIVDLEKVNTLEDERIKAAMYLYFERLSKR